MITSWRVEVFGGLRVLGGNEVWTHFPTHRMAVLLAYLALHRQSPHPREELADILWPDASREAGRLNLRVALSTLRHQLEPPSASTESLFLTTRQTIQLHPATVTIDVVEFRQHLAQSSSDPALKLATLTNAIQCYQGDLLPGFYEDWIQAERERLFEQYREALEQAVSLCEQLGKKEKALTYARQLVAADPFYADQRLCLMRLLTERGQRVEALRQYAEYEHLLRSHFDEEPSPALRDFALQLQAQTATHLITPSQPRRFLPHNIDSHSAPREAILPLPPRSRACLGRETEIAALLALIGSSNPLLTAPPPTLPVSEAARPSLITLVGLPGVGKSRLALEVAAILQKQPSFSCWYLPLREVSAPAGLQETLQAALQPILTSGASVEGVLQQHLTGQAGLLLIDDYYAWGASDFAYLSHLLRAVPGLQILVTARAALQQEEERVFFVLPLPVPPQETPEATLDHLRENASIQLFLARAQSVRPHFHLSSHNADEMASLCQRLEGIPLALELAAERTATMTVGQILQAMQNPFDLLVSRRRDHPEPHRSLRTLWETDLRTLSSPTRHLLAQLSAIKSTWSRGEVLARFPEETTDILLEELCAHFYLSCIETEEQELYFRILELIRQLFQSASRTFLLDSGG